MDTSKKYIKMCEKAEEIQGQRHIPTDWQKGDWFLRAGTSWIEVVSHQINFSNLSIPRGTVWLPRQDQLQEMMDKWYKNNPHVLVSDFYDSIYEEPMPSYYVPKNFTSMEQLWLAFVMREKYHKIWKEDTWKDGAN